MSPPHHPTRPRAGHQGAPLRLAASGHDLGRGEAELRGPLAKDRRAGKSAAGLDLNHRPGSAELVLPQRPIAPQVPEVVFVNYLCHDDNLAISQAVSTSISQGAAKHFTGNTCEMGRADRLLLAMRRAKTPTRRRIPTTWGRATDKRWRTGHQRRLRRGVGWGRVKRWAPLRALYLACFSRLR